MNDILPYLIGGLILFLFSIFQLSTLLKGIFTLSAQKVIRKSTANIVKAILIGMLMTILLGSSSAVIIIAIVFINSGTLRFKDSAGIIMGANIGTTITSQLIVLDIAQFSIWIMLFALILEFFIDDTKHEAYVRILFYFGMLFFGLHLMESSVLPLKDSNIFMEWMTQVDAQPIKGSLVGGLITLIIQSSSTTVGIAIILGKQNILSTAGGIAIMIGAELGTCSDTLLATIRGSRQAVKAGLFHLTFNVVSITIGLVLFHPFVELVEIISGYDDIARQIANAHVLFNVLGVVVFLPFVGLIIKVLNALIPDKKTIDSSLKHAYINTLYVTIEEPVFSIKIGSKHKIVDDYMTRFGYQNWILISAENPQSLHKSEFENKENTNALEDKLDSNGYHFLRGLGIPQSEGWIPEISFLVFDISKDDALELALEFDQKAIVSGEKNKKATLIICS